MPSLFAKSPRELGSRTFHAGGHVTLAAPFVTRFPFLVRLRGQAARQRSALFRAFVEGMPRPVRILDLGGTVEMWQRWRVAAADGFEVTLLNHHRIDSTHRDEKVAQGFIRTLRMDAMELDRAVLGQFDVIFSNSMLEHLPSREDQARLAQIIERSGLSYFIQVPNRHAPVDPHFPHPLVPFFAMYPRSLQAHLHSKSALGSGYQAPSVDAAHAAFVFYNPLGRAQMHRLFPAAKVHYQWTLGVPMSVIARRRI